MDARLGYHDLEQFKRLIAPLGGPHAASAVRIGDTDLTPLFRTHVNHLLSRMTRSEGTLTGRIERLNVHGQRTFRLYRPGRGTAVVCTFPNTLFEQVREGLRRSVTVSGTIIYAPDGGLPERVEVRELQVHPAANTLPKLTDLRGTLGPDATGGESVVEFVHALREDWEVPSSGREDRSCDTEAGAA